MGKETHRQTLETPAEYAEIDISQSEYEDEFFEWISEPLDNIIDEMNNLFKSEGEFYKNYEKSLKDL